MTYGVLVISELRRRQFDERLTGLARVQFAERVSSCLNKEVILYQSGRKKPSPGYFAVAILLDAGVSALDARFLYLTFSKPTYFRDVVPVHSAGPIVESSVRNADGKLDGRKFSEDFRTLREDEFLELTGESRFQQTEPPQHLAGFSDSVVKERQRVLRETWLRSIAARSLALPLYDYSCAATGQKMVTRNGLGTSLHVCHLMSVAAGGLDMPSNLVVFCPDFHARYDDGTIDILDDFTWIPIGSHQEEITSRWSGPRKLFVPDDPELRPDPRYLAAHRSEVRQRQGR